MRLVTANVGGTRSQPSGRRLSIFERVVAPVHQRVPPGRLGHVTGRSLRQVPADVGDHLAHVRRVVLAEVSLSCTQERDDATSGLVARELLATVLVPDCLRLRGVSSQSDSSSFAVRLTESCQSSQISSTPSAALSPDMAQPFRFRADGLWTAVPPPFSLRTRHCGSS